jgi:hypothetical protein
MARAHFNKVVQDAQGNLVGDISVSVFTPGTNNPIVETLYQADDPDTETYPNPFTDSDGVVDFYLSTPLRVDVQVTKDASVTLFANVDVGAQPSTSLILTDDDGIDWQVTVGTDGALTTTNIGPA